MKGYKKCIGILLIYGFALSGNVLAQEPDWQNKDLLRDSVFGISTNKAYHELLGNKRAKRVIVAVIDGGLDTSHEDLKQVLWTNPGEIAGNNQDDDHNGYTDDIHGWNFIGGKTGDVNYDNFEMTRLIRERHVFYDSLSAIGTPPRYQAAYETYRNMKMEYDSRLAEATSNYAELINSKKSIDSVLYKIGKSHPVLADIQSFVPATASEARVKAKLIAQLTQTSDFSDYLKRFDHARNYYEVLLHYYLNQSFDPRNMVGDDYQNSAQRYYGNNDGCGPHALHGTHVAGIIAAVRDNGIGINGIADQVQIMGIRVVPDGDERDKDVANGIRYAADNGATVINMSFDKPYSEDKRAVDEAVKYAMSRDVLIIHAAGNDGKNIDLAKNVIVPTKYYQDSSGMAKAWITVGASGPKDDSTLVAGFSNYGRKNVDVFAPGVHIYSSIPGSKYTYEDGTSMAAPVVTGLAALIREYYPELTAVQVKEIIMRSVVKPAHPVKVRDGDATKKVLMSDICVSGGVVNAYQALLLAATYKK